MPPIRLGVIGCGAIAQIQHLPNLAGLQEEFAVTCVCDQSPALAAHVATHTPEWAERVTGVPAARIVALARRYGTTKPAMIVLGGSSMHKGAGSWTSARAVGCLPALTGNVGIPGGGLGPRHGAAVHG